MSGAPPDDGDAEGRAPKRGRLNIFGELGKLYDDGLQAQKETHEQEMQALREAHKQEVETREQEMQALREAHKQEVQKKETYEQKVQTLNAEVHMRFEHSLQVAIENQKLREQLQKRGAPVAVSSGLAVPNASFDEPKRVWMIYYDTSRELTMDVVETAWPASGLERIETVRVSCTVPPDTQSYVSLFCFKDPQLRWSLCQILYVIFRFNRSKIRVSVECTRVYSGTPEFLSIRTVEMWGVGPNKEKILRHLRDWQKQGPYVWTKNEAPRFPFEQLHV
jgi:hypothetical protein